VKVAAYAEFRVWIVTAPPPCFEKINERITAGASRLRIGADIPIGVEEAGFVHEPR